MIHSYRVYGLEVVSSVAIPGLQPFSLSPTVLGTLYFEAGPAPDWVTAATAQPATVLSQRGSATESTDPTFVLTRRAGACFFLDYSDGTRFAVTADANRVWGHYEPPLTEADLATYFLGPVLGFILRLRLQTPLHASSVEICGKGIALCGDAGAGKSTTAAALALLGVPVLAEDITPLREVDGAFYAIPGYPRVCLWPESVAHLFGSPDALPQLTPVWDKRFLALDGSGAHFRSTPLPLALIYLFSQRQSVAAPRIEHASPREVLLELVQNTYMNWLLDKPQRAAEFDLLARLVAKVPVRRIIPHSDPQQLPKLCELLVSDAQHVISASAP